MSACLPGFPALSIQLTLQKRIWRKNIRSVRSWWWILWEHLPDMGFLWINLQTFGMRDRSIEEVHAWAEEHKLNLHHWFFSTDLTFYIRGGRISKASGFFGTMLNICPLLNMDDQGKLIPRFKIRTKKKVIRAIVDKMEEYAEGGLDYSWEMLYFPVRMYRGCQGSGKAGGRAFPEIKWEG